MSTAKRSLIKRLVTEFRIKLFAGCVQIRSSLTTKITLSCFSYLHHHVQTMRQKLCYLHFCLANTEGSLFNVLISVQAT